MEKFIFNDETIYNSYGFRTDNKGIDLTRFTQNPIMLDGHWNDNESVIGKWQDFNFNGINLSGLPVFDMEDGKAKMIAGKVERGFIKACSMGLVFSPENMVIEANGKWLLSKSELLEVSIVPVPSNKNAIRLYAEKNGEYELMNEDEIKMCLTGLSTKKETVKNTKKDNEKFYAEIKSLLELQDDSNNDDILMAIKELLKATNDSKDNAVEQMLNLALKEYSLDATEIEFYRGQAKLDLSTVTNILINPSKKRNRLIVLKNENIKTDRTKWTLEDYRKNDPDALTKDNELFEKLLKAESIK